MARPNLTSLFSKFLFRETLTSEEKGYIRSDIGAETAGAAATAQALAISTASGDAITKANAAQAAAIAASQPLDSDLTAIAALTTTALGRSLLTGASEAAIRALMGAGTSDLPAALELTRTPSYRYAEAFLTGVALPTNSDFFTIGSESFYWGSAPSAFEIAVGANQIDSWTNAAITINRDSVFLRAVATSDGVYIVAKNAGTAGNALAVIVTNSPCFTAPSYLTGGSATYNLTTPTAIGQTAIVTHSDDSKTEWGAVSLTEWLPRTAGIIQRSGGDWYHQTLATDGTAEYELIPNQ